MDYLKKLDDAELKFMNQFMGEYVSGAFRKNEFGEYSEDNFHKTPEERRKCYTRNNTRNRCGLTVSNATGQTVRCDDIAELVDNVSASKYATNDNNVFSDLICDEYGGSYQQLENELLKEMQKDYQRCIDPKSNSDRAMLESNYGKFLLLKFNDSDL
jgi:hypothetical protein